MITTCEQCGISQEDGKHPKMTEPLTDDNFLEYAKLQCALCRAQFTLQSIQAYGGKGWTVVKSMQRVFCPHCSHYLSL